MLRYLALSFLLNLFLFSLYSYWVGKALVNAFKESSKFITPLFVNIKTEIEKPPQKEVKPRGKAKIEKPSILKGLMPIVKEYELAFKRIETRAKGELLKSGKVKFFLNRKIVYIPPVKPIKVKFPPSPVEVKITVLPDGRVVDAIILKRSGNLKVDEAVLRLVRNLRFEPINKPIIQDIYIEFRFRF